MKRRMLRGKLIYGMSLLLAGGLLLCSCGDNGDVRDESLVSAEQSVIQGSSEEVKDTQKPDSSEEVKDVEKPGSSEDAKDTQKPGSSESGKEQDVPGDVDTEQGTENTSVPLMLQTVWRDNRYTEDGTLLVEGSFQSIEVSGDGFEAVAEAVRNWFVDKEKGFQETIDLYEKGVQEAMKDTPHFGRFSSHVESDSTRSDSSVVSFCCLFREYAGGAHDNYGSVGATFDVKSGRQLSFWDLTADRESFSQKTLDYCLHQVVEDYGDGLFDDYKETIQTVWQNEPNWYLDAAGITVIFNPYELGPFAMGEAFVTLPYQEFDELLLPEYRMGSRAGVAVLPEGVSAELCLGKESDGEMQLRLYRESQEDNKFDYGFSKYLLDVGAQTEVVAELNWLKDSYILRREDGRTFLLFDGDVASDDYVTYVYELTDGQIRKVYESPACTEIREGTVTLQGLQLGIRVDMLGTYTVYGDFGMAEDGSLLPQGEWYEIYNPYAGGVLTNIKELPVVVEGKETVLPAGNRLWVTGTDMRGILRYQLVDSAEEGEIYFEYGPNGWPIYIDGVSELEYFEDLPYAG